MTILCTGSKCILASHCEQFSSYICLEWEDFEIDLAVLLGMKI